MKKLIFSLLMLVTFTAFAQTQPDQSKPERENKTPEERATAIASHLEKNLGLTADQKTKVHDLALTKEQKIDQLREQNKGKDRCAWADQRKQTQDEFDAGMKKILTPDQYTKWNAEKEERKKEAQEHQRPESNKTPEQRADGMSSHLEKDLGLTPDQKTKVRDLVLNKEKSMDQLNEKYKGQDPCAGATERKQIRDTFENGMKTTLTPEQFQKWQDQKKQHMEQRKNKMQGPPPPQEEGK
ncbi:MAG TPA: hypothetical protein VFJ43_01050 [Bacteroidia bacterium]|nr:hypothetical protein [Bacteroidia bacterium]